MNRIARLWQTQNKSKPDWTVATESNEWRLGTSSCGVVDSRNRGFNALVEHRQLAEDLQATCRPGDISRTRPNLYLPNVFRLWGRFMTAKCFKHQCRVCAARYRVSGHCNATPGRNRESFDGQQAVVWLLGNCYLDGPADSSSSEALEMPAMPPWAKRPSVADFSNAPARPAKFCPCASICTTPRADRKRRRLAMKLRIHFTIRCTSVAFDRGK